MSGAELDRIQKIREGGADDLSMGDRRQSQSKHGIRSRSFQQKAVAIHRTLLDELDQINFVLRRYQGVAEALDHGEKDAAGDDVCGRGGTEGVSQSRTSRR